MAKAFVLVSHCYEIPNGYLYLMCSLCSTCLIYRNVKCNVVHNGIKSISIKKALHCCKAFKAPPLGLEPRTL